MILLKNMLYRLRCKRALRSIYSLEDFHQILKQEQLRSDRNNHKFSLITFDMGECKNDMSHASPLVKYIKSRVRFSDKIGWFDERRIGLFLPETLLKGARKLARAICMNSASTASITACTVYMYPAFKWYNEECYSKPACPEENMYGKLSAVCKMPLWKRAMDITVSLSGLIIFLPLFVTVAVMIKIVSKGPVFFRQERVGLSGKKFTMLKFRTMKVYNDTAIHRRHTKECINGSSDGEKPMIKLDDNDSRIIPMGNFFRETCIDEIPQLINVLRGEMSLVGPRPCIPYEAEEYLRWQTQRFDITPGMTGLWQVSGKNKTTFKEMIRLDIQYAAQRSFWLDMKILLITPGVLILQVFESLKNLKKKETLEHNQIKVRTAGGLIVKA